jgi:hypothetical protein
VVCAQHRFSYFCDWTFETTVGSMPCIRVVLLGPWNGGSGLEGVRLRISLTWIYLISLIKDVLDSGLEAF